MIFDVKKNTWYRCSNLMRSMAITGAGFGPVEPGMLTYAMAK